MFTPIRVFDLSDRKKQRSHALGWPLCFLHFWFFLLQLIDQHWLEQKKR